MHETKRYITSVANAIFTTKKEEYISGAYNSMSYISMGSFYNYAVVSYLCLETDVCASFRPKEQLALDPLFY